MQVTPHIKQRTEDIRKKLNAKIKSRNPCANKVNEKMMIIASTGEGKSQMLTHLLKTVYAKGVFNRIYFFDPSWKDDIYKDVFAIDDNMYTINSSGEKLINPNCRAFSDVSQKIVDHVIEDINKQVELKKGNFFSLFILDDCQELFMDRRSPLALLMSRIRHSNISVILTAQYLFNIAKNARAQFNSFAIFPNVIQEDIDGLHGLTPVNFQHPERNVLNALGLVRKVNDRVIEETGKDPYGYLYFRKKGSPQYFYGMETPIDEVLE